jgi:hypothetical protein
MKPTRDEFIAMLQKAHDGAEHFSCLGCLLDVAGLRGGQPNGARAFPGDSYYVTGEKGAHDYCPRSARWLRRVIKASILDLKQQSPKDCSEPCPTPLCPEGSGLCPEPGCGRTRP